MSSDGTAPARRPAAATSFVRWMVAGVALVNLFVFGVIALLLYQSFSEAEERAEVTSQTLAHLLALDLDGDIDKIDVTLQAAADEVGRQLTSGRVDRPALDAFLARLQGRLPEAFSLRATDADGVVQYGNDVDPAARPRNADREYFARQRDHPDAGLVIAGPVFARIDKRWVVPISRAVHLPDGSFAGVVYANVSLAYLSMTLSAVDVGRRGSISLRDQEMRVFAASPEPEHLEKVIGQRLVVPELQELIRAGREGGSYVTTHTVDGVERRFAARRTPRHPLYVVVGRATEEYLARWRDQVNKTAALAALFLLTTLASTWLISRSWTRQAAAAQELAREEERFHTVADYTYDWEYWEGPAREILYISPSCERVTGYSRQEFVADPDLLHRIILPDDRHLMAGHERAVAHEVDAPVDFRIVRRDGELRWIGHACQTVSGRDGTPMGRRVSNRDITDRKQAEHEIHRLNAELEQRVVQRTAELAAANQELEEFSYSISHDLRSPLRAIAGFAQILVEEHSGGLDDEASRLLDVVRSNTVRMGQLIDALLEFLQVGRQRMELRPIDTASLVQEVFATLQASAPGRELHLAIESPPRLLGDRAMIRQLLTSLLSNAVKFTQPRPRALIEVGGSSDAAESHCYVKDNGVGFDMRYADKLFRVFEHVHPVGQFEGSGTGLAMVKRIVARHGGRVWAEGRVDEGATIHFTLPARAGRDAAGR